MFLILCCEFKKDQPFAKTCISQTSIFSIICSEYPMESEANEGIDVCFMMLDALINVFDVIFGSRRLISLVGNTEWLSFTFLFLNKGPTVIKWEAS